MDEPKLDEVLRALSHADRRQFLRACLHKERAAGELAERSSLATASVSEHLKVLRKSGLLSLEIRGRFWMYRTNRKALCAAVAALACLEETPDGP